MTAAFICFLWLSSAALFDWRGTDILIAPCTAPRICVSVYIFSFVGSGPPAPSALLLWEETHSTMWTIPLLPLCIDLEQIGAYLTKVRVRKCCSRERPRNFVFFLGAAESDFSGDAETGSDRRSVFPQTQVGQHGGDAQQLSTKGARGHGSKKGRGMGSLQTGSCTDCFFPPKLKVKIPFQKSPE